MNPKISLVTAVEACETLVLPWFQADSDENEKSNGKKKEETPEFKMPEFAGKKEKELASIKEWLGQSKHFTGRKNETSLLRYTNVLGAKNLLLLGLGAQKKWSSELARQAGAAVFLTQRKEKLAEVSIHEGLFASFKSGEAEYFLQAFCEGYSLAGYQYMDLKSEKGPQFNVVGASVAVSKKTSALESAVETAGHLANAVNFARALGDKPGNVLTPTEMASLATKMAKEFKLKCSILGKSEIQKEKMGLLWGVAKGSSEEPKLIVLEYHGGKKGDKPIALVGKGVTFDSGGISIKPSSGMEDMKYDMMGAAAVLGTCQAIASLKLAVNVVGIVAATENMPGGRAQKPGDVATSMTGKTVEIVNTDAEGRLILADAMEYCQKHFEPQCMIDFATLTGAVVVALGSVTSGIMGTSSELIKRLKASSEKTGERVWELPLYDEYFDDLKSHYADLKNSGVRDAGSSKGGVFLKHFVNKKLPWVHCDIAGSSYHRGDVNYHSSKYAAGTMIRLMADVLENWKPIK